MSSDTEESLRSAGVLDPLNDPQYIRLRRSHLYLALIPLAFGLGMVYGYILWGREQVIATEADFGASQARRIDVDPGDDPSFGPIDAPITLVEFSDYSCPYCQLWHREVSQELFATFPDQIRFVYKDFPIVQGGRVGTVAAQAAHCADEQDAYWDYHDALLSGDYTLDPSGYEQAAQDLKLDEEALMECVNSERYVDEVAEDLDYGVSIGVSSTPTFFINGIPLIGAQPLENFVELINSELGN